MWYFTSSFVRSLKRPVFVYLSTLALTLQLIFAAVFYQIEAGTNEDVKTFFDAFYYSVTVISGVGLGDIIAVTTLGRVVTILMMLSGTVIFVSFTGVLATSILQVESLHLDRKNRETKDF